MPQMLFCLIIVLLGACISPDPAVGAMIIMGWMLGLMGIIILPLIIYEKIMTPKWEAAREAAWKKKYPNTKSLAEFMKELDNK